MPRWCLVPKCFNIILSNLWPLKIKHYASNIIAGLLAWVNAGMPQWKGLKLQSRLSISNSAARQLFVYTRTATGNVDVICGVGAKLGRAFNCTRLWYAEVAGKT